MQLMNRMHLMKLESPGPLITDFPDITFVFGEEPTQSGQRQVAHLHVSSKHYLAYVVRIHVVKYIT